MSSKRPIHNVQADNFLSLEKVDLDLEPLNVLAGPNGSGKTNFLKIFDFLGRVAENDLAPAVSELGGSDGMIFQNAVDRRFRIAIKGTITKLSHANALDEYSLRIDPHQFRRRVDSHSDREVLFRREQFKFKRVEGRGRRITLSGSDLKIYDRTSNKKIGSEGVSNETSGLSLLRKLGQSFEAEQVEQIADLFLSLRLVDIDVRRLRQPVRLDGARYLSSTGSNVASFLLRLREEHPSAFADIEDDMRFVLPTFDRFEIKESGGGDRYVTISIVERPFAEAIPLDRASFGTIRAIVLFSMLHDPSPPRLTCVEEIDHGFHPQALDRLVDRLRDATERTQIILATHSPALVNRLRPEELVMFRRDVAGGGTHAIKPNRAFVMRAKKKYGYELGELWFSGLLDED